MFARSYPENDDFFEATIGWRRTRQEQEVLTLRPHWSSSERKGEDYDDNYSQLLLCV